MSSSRPRAGDAYRPLSRRTATGSHPCVEKITACTLADTCPPAPQRPSHSSVRLRELGAGELDVLEAVFDGLGPTSRLRRFHGPVSVLLPRTRELLAAVDGRRHIAVAAFVDSKPVGIARLVDVGEGCAELAVEVVDAWQRRGVGTRLVRAVAERGRAVGHTCIAADVLAENLPAQLLLTSIFTAVTRVEDGAKIRFTADLASLEDGSPCAA